jgi:hypothetical protein
MINKDSIIETDKETTLFDEVFLNLLTAYNGARHFDVDIKTETLVDMAEYLCKKFEDKYYEGYHKGYKVGYYYGKQDAYSAERAEPTNNNDKIEMDCDEYDRGYTVGKVHGMLSMLNSDNEVNE